MHEYASTAGNRKARADLVRFYEADNAPAAQWTDLALGRIDILPPRPRTRSTRKLPAQLNKRLYRWERNYIVVLKVADLHLSGGRSVAKMEALLRWMYEDFIMAGPAMILAAYYFAPNAPKKGLLKSLQSPDRERALRGAKNAAWDLMLLSDWVRRVMGLDQMEDDTPSPVLCSMDKGATRIARHMIVFDDEDISEEDAVARMFVSIWGKKDGEALAQLYASYRLDLDNPSRHFRRTTGLEFIVPMIEAGERRIRG